MKTVLISCFHPLISRNILETDVLRYILRAHVRVVLLVPEKKKKYFLERFGSDTVSVEGIDVPRKRFEDFLYSLSMSFVDVHNHVVDDWRLRGRYAKYYFAHAFHVLCARFFLFHRLTRAVARWYLSADTFDRVFDTHTPDLVFATDLFDRSDRALILAAQRRGLGTLGMVRSWDNPTTKGVLMAVPDRVIVHNNILRDEMISIHRIPPNLITVTGIPHQDVVLKGPPQSRGEFFEEIGLNPQKQTILFAPCGRILYRHDAELLSMLKRLCDRGAFGDVQFLVRCPPGDKVDTSAIEDDKRFVIDRPGTNLTGRRKENELSRTDNERLLNSLFHADVVMTVVSSIAIDGTICDRPVIIIGFDPPGASTDTVTKFSTNPHFKKFLDTGLVSVSHSEEELVALATLALREPDFNKESRDDLVRMYAYALDGRSGERVARAVLARLG